ncbi:MAG: glycosyltransferase family 2 protein [Polyangia bacterium]|jgi:glycosyltransferase involved in cell wall biosynthesis
MESAAPSWSELRARFHRRGTPFGFIVPLFNHPRNVGQVVSQALTSGAPVVVVDDGSTTGAQPTPADLAGARVVRHPANQGKGAAIITGLRALAEAPLRARYAVTVDADGQHDPDEARALLASLCPSEASAPALALVLGARTSMRAGAAPWTSRAGRRFSGFWVWAAGGPLLSDSQSGFRVYPVAETLALPTRARRFEFEVEVLVQAARVGIPIQEVPVTVCYTPAGGRVSHFRPWRDFVRNAATFTRLLATRFRHTRRWPGLPR